MTGQINWSPSNVLVMECSWGQDEHPLLKGAHEEDEELGGVGGDVLLHAEGHLYTPGGVKYTDPTVGVGVMKKDAKDDLGEKDERLKRMDARMKCWLAMRIAKELVIYITTLMQSIGSFWFESFKKKLSLYVIFIMMNIAESRRQLRSVLI